MTVSVTLLLPPSTPPSGVALSPPPSRAAPSLPPPSLASTPVSGEPPSLASEPASTGTPELLPEAPDPTPEALPLAVPEAPRPAPEVVPLAAPLPDVLPLLAPDVPDDAFELLLEPQPNIGTHAKAARTRRSPGRSVGMRIGNLQEVFLARPETRLSCTSMERSSRRFRASAVI